MNDVTFSVPYKKLTDETKVGPIRPTIASRPRYCFYNNGKLKKEWSSLLIFLIVLYGLTSVLFLYKIFQRSDGFRGQDEEFDKFMKMLGNEEDTKWPELDAEDLPLVFQGAGPVIKTEIEPIHRPCQATQLLNCNNKQNFFEEQQNKIDKFLGNQLYNISSDNKELYVLKQVMTKCVQDFKTMGNDRIEDFAQDLKSLQRASTFTKASTPTKMALINSALKKYDAVNNLFELTVERNYLMAKKDKPYVIYLTQKVPENPDVATMTLMRKAMKALSLNEHNLQQLYLNIPRISSFQTNAEEVSNWHSFTASSANTRWPFFDFKTFFSTLTEDLEDIVFVVRTPEYFDKLNQFFNAMTNEKKLELSTLLATYNVISAYGKYLGVDKVRTDLTAKHHIGQLNQIDVLTFCAADIRQNLHGFVSRLIHFTRDDSEQKKENKVNDLVKKIKWEIIRTIQKSEHTEETKLNMIEKINNIKINTVSTNKRSNWGSIFDVNIESRELYFDMVGDMKNFAFKKSMGLLNLKEAGRGDYNQYSEANLEGLQYYYIGNYLNIPEAVLMLNVFNGDGSVNTKFYTELGWKLTEEILKSIDEEGSLFDRYGIYKISENDVDSTKTQWKNKLSCLRSKTNGESNAKDTSNTIWALNIIREVFTREVEGLINNNPIVKGTSAMGISKRNFFNQAASRLCHMKKEVSTTLVTSYIDDYFKSANLFGCKAEYKSKLCPLDF